MSKASGFANSLWIISVNESERTQNVTRKWHSRKMGYMCLGKVECEVLLQTKGEEIISRTDVDTQEDLQLHVCLKNIGNRKKNWCYEHKTATRIRWSSSHQLRMEYECGKIIIVKWYCSCDFIADQPHPYGSTAEKKLPLLETSSLLYLFNHLLSSFLCLSLSSHLFLY